MPPLFCSVEETRKIPDTLGDGEGGKKLNVIFFISFKVHEDVKKAAGFDVITRGDVEPLVFINYSLCRSFSDFSLLEVTIHSLEEEF